METKAGADFPWGEPTVVVVGVEYLVLNRYSDIIIIFGQISNLPFYIDLHKWYPEQLLFN